MSNSILISGSLKGVSFKIGVWGYIYSLEDTDISSEGQIREWNEERGLHSKIVVNEGGAEKVKPGHLVL